MKRVHVFEFEDAKWFPPWLRISMTNVIIVLSRALGVTPVLAALVSRVLAEMKIDRIVDLGSGAGGVMPEVLERVRQSPGLEQTSLLMTDLYPNRDSVAAFDASDRPHLRYEANSVDATDLASVPRGLKTMVNSFHHMRPAQARQILESACESGQPLLVYEFGENKMPFALWCIALPIALPLVALSCCLLTPFVRPFTIRQFLFTYVIPLIPIFYAWDGQASMPRLYGFDDLDELLEGLGSSDYPNYRWEKGHATAPNGRKGGAYLLGLPN